MQSNDFAEIRDLDLFRDISDEAFSRLTRGAYVKNFPPQIELISEGDSADFLHVVTAGMVELFCEWEDRKSTLATVSPVSTFILAATITDQIYLMSARTLQKSRILLLPSEDVRHVFETDSNFAKSIVRELAVCYRSVIRNTKNLKLRTSSERLANYLLKTSRLNGAVEEFELPIEKRRLAALLGMTPENLSRSITSLKPHGIEVDRNVVIIRDAAKLERYCRPTPLIDNW